MRYVSSRHRKNAPRAKAPLFANPRSSERSGEIGTVAGPFFFFFFFARCDFLLSRANISSPDITREHNRHARAISTRGRAMHLERNVIEEDVKYQLIYCCLCHYWPRIKGKINFKINLVFSEIWSLWEKSPYLIFLFSRLSLNQLWLNYTWDIRLLLWTYSHHKLTFSVQWETENLTELQSIKLYMCVKFYISQCTANVNLWYIYIYLLFCIDCIENHVERLCVKDIAR